jgi:hypothetical protein
MSGRSVETLSDVLSDVLPDVLPFVLFSVRTAGFWLGCAGSGGSAFSDISMCAGDLR